MVAPLNLTGGRLPVKADAGDNISFGINAIAFNTTGFTLEMRFYELANDQAGPTGAVIDAYTLTEGDGITNAGGTDSLITIAIPSTTTAGRDGGGLWMELVRTDVGFVRTLAKGPLVLE